MSIRVLIADDHRWSVPTKATTASDQWLTKSASHCRRHRGGSCVRLPQCAH
jgi:hypothetical protein